MLVHLFLGVLWTLCYECPVGFKREREKEHPVIIIITELAASELGEGGPWPALSWAEGAERRTPQTLKVA